MRERFLGYGSPEALEQAIQDSKGEQGEEFVIYAEGLMAASVCSSLPFEEVKQRMAQVICGTTHGWQFAENETFSGGEPNPRPCNQKPETHKHYLFEC